MESVRTAPAQLSRMRDGKATARKAAPMESAIRERHLKSACAAESLDAENLFRKRSGAEGVC